MERNTAASRPVHRRLLSELSGLPKPYIPKRLQRLLNEYQTNKYIHILPTPTGYQNNVTGVVGKAEDVTEQKRIENELAKLKSMQKNRIV